MSTKISLTVQDLETINAIVVENDINGVFDVIYTEGGGIGYCVDVEFPLAINGREAIVRIPVTGVENW